MKKIGGFLGLELPFSYYSPSRKTLALTSGRSCLNFILREIRPKRVYVPFFSCPALIEPLRYNKVSFSYYRLDKCLNPCLSEPLGAQEYLIYINYFGIKRSTVDALLAKFGDKVIVDNAQAFYEDNSGSWAFNSARKFFGVPDGAFLYSPRKIKSGLKPNTDIHVDYLINRLIGKQEMAYRQFIRSERKVTLQLRGISEISLRILKTVNFIEIADKRRKNFLFLHQRLKKLNNFKFDLASKSVPLCYPFFPEREIDKAILHKNGIFVPTYWKLAADGRLPDFEMSFVRRLLPLPIDQRYGMREMMFIADKVCRLLT